MFFEGAYVHFCVRVGVCFLRVKIGKFEGAFVEGKFFLKMRVRLFIFEGVKNHTPFHYRASPVPSSCQHWQNDGYVSEKLHPFFKNISFFSF